MICQGCNKNKPDTTPRRLWEGYEFVLVCNHCNSVHAYEVYMAGLCGYEPPSPKMFDLEKVMTDEELLALISKELRDTFDNIRGMRAPNPPHAIDVYIIEEEDSDKYVARVWVHDGVISFWKPDDPRLPIAAAPKWFTNKCWMDLIDNETRDLADPESIQNILDHIGDHGGNYKLDSWSD